MLEAGIQKAKPVNIKKNDIRGNVVSNRVLRPNVSIVFIAGIAKKKLTIPTVAACIAQPVSDRFAGEREKNETARRTAILLQWQAQAQVMGS